MYPIHRIMYSLFTFALMEKLKILFVCLGNICRSPSAEAVFKAYIKREKVGDLFEVDSAGLIGHHAGEPADARMRTHALRRGYELTSISRPITYEDYFYFDHIIGMDESNRQALLDRAPTEDLAKKVSLLTDWHPQPLLNYIPDPYYGGAEGFEQVLNLIESCVPFLYSRSSQELNI